MCTKCHLPRASAPFKGTCSGCEHQGAVWIIESTDPNERIRLVCWICILAATQSPTRENP